MSTENKSCLPDTTQESWQSVRFDNGQFTAVKPSGEVLTSPDGVVWTTQEKPKTIPNAPGLWWGQFNDYVGVEVFRVKQMEGALIAVSELRHEYRLDVVKIWLGPVASYEEANRMREALSIIVTNNACHCIVHGVLNHCPHCLAKNALSAKGEV